MAQIFGIAGRRHRRKLSGHSAEEQGNHGHSHQNYAHADNIGQVSLRDSHVDDFRHLKRNQNLHQNLQNDKYRGQNGLPSVLSDGFKEFSVHGFLLLFYLAVMSDGIPALYSPAPCRKGSWTFGPAPAYRYPDLPWQSPAASVFPHT